MSDKPTGDEKAPAEPNLIVSQEDADRIYNELRSMHVDLDADPLVFGPKRLNAKVSEVRGHLDRCERVFLDVAQRLHAIKRQHRMVSTMLELSKKHLYANDPETRSGRSVADREAIAIGKLKDDVTKANTLDVAAQDLESIIMVIKARRSDLRDTQGRLKDQIRLCQEEIGLGGRWGSKLPDAPELHPGKVVASVKDIDSMLDGLDGIDGELHLPEGKEVPEVPVVETPTEWEQSVKDEDIPEVVKVAAHRPPAVVEETEVEEAEEDEGFLELPEAPAGQESLDKALPPSASQDAVDTFLSIGVAAEKVPTPPGAKPPPLDDDTLDDFLDTFEKA